MQLGRFFSVVDLGIAALIIFTFGLPPREMYASAAIRGDDAEQFAIGLAEARTIARPADGLAVEDLGRRLGHANMKDWAVDATVRASERAKDSPTRWRALLAASVALVDKIDVKPALDYANRALSACTSAQERGELDACPKWEEIRMSIYQQSLDAGVKSGIDPRRDPAGFRKAGEKGLLQIRLGGRANATGASNGSAATDGSAAATGSATSPAP
jgi:hypothetical protein